MIIGVTGLSGTGKSTLSESLGKILNNAKVIHIDTVHVSLLMKNPSLVINIYGEEIIKNGKFDGDLFIKYPEKLRKVFEISYKYLVVELNNEIEKVKKTEKFIILDFFALSKIKEIWQLCDYTILVKAINESKRIENISLRHIKDGKNPNIDIALRDDFAPDYDLYKYDFYVLNNYDLNFINDINNIANQLFTEQYKFVNSNTETKCQKR